NFDVPGFEGAKYVFTPPLREKWHQEKLWQGLAKDTLQVVSTDHCPFCYKEQKELGKDDFTKIPNGGPGIEHRLSLVYTGGVHGKRFSANRFVQLVSTAPAKLFGLYPHKGTVAGARTPTWFFSTRMRSKSSAPRRTTCAWTIRCLRVFASRVRRRRCFRGAVQSSRTASSLGGPEPGSLFGGKRTPGHSWRHQMGGSKAVTLFLLSPSTAELSVPPFPPGTASG